MMQVDAAASPVSSWLEAGLARVPEPVRLARREGDRLARSGNVRLASRVLVADQPRRTVNASVG
jgi:hypothetical protein